MFCLAEWRRMSRRMSKRLFFNFVFFLSFISHFPAGGGKFC